MPSRKPANPKYASLREQGTLNPRPEKIGDPLFLEHEFFDARDLVQVKYELLRRVRTEGQSVTQATTAFGFSRPLFYQAQAAFEQEGISGLIPKKRGPRQAHKLTQEIMDFVEGILAEDGSARGAELAQRVKQRFSIVVHPRSIERALARRKKKRR